MKCSYRHLEWLKEKDKSDNIKCWLRLFARIGVGRQNGSTTLEDRGQLLIKLDTHVLETHSHISTHLFLKDWNQIFM